MSAACIKYRTHCLKKLKKYLIFKEKKSFLAQKFKVAPKKISDFFLKNETIFIDFQPLCSVVTQASTTSSKSEMKGKRSQGTCVRNSHETPLWRRRCAFWQQYCSIANGHGNFHPSNFYFISRPSVFERDRRSIAFLGTAILRSDKSRKVGQIAIHCSVL